MAGSSPKAGLVPCPEGNTSRGAGMRGEQMEEQGGRVNKVEVTVLCDVISAGTTRDTDISLVHVLFIRSKVLGPAT